MAFKAKKIFLSALLLQVILLMIYLATRDSLFSNVGLHPDISKKCGIVQIDANWTTESLHPRKSGVFQPIDGRQSWLYSAFYDHVAAQDGRPLVRVFGLVKRACTLKIFCNFFNEDIYLSQSTGVITLLPGEHGVDYPPSYLECPLSSNVHPTHVSVSFEKTTEKSTNRLQILYPGPRIRNFTVCYSVLHSNFSMATQLIENIEMNRILGAEHFMVYNYSISPEVSQILSRYREDGLVTVLQWLVPNQESWYFAQMTALNDCFYRNRNTSRFVVVLDTDELIVPRSHRTWMELIHNISPHEIDVSRFMNSSDSPNSEHTQTGCFIVQSSFFTSNSTSNLGSLQSQLSFKADEKKNIIKYNLLTLLQAVRQDHIYPHKERSKYIARPELIYISGVHEVHKLTNAMNCLHVNETLALTHHYRGYDKPYPTVDDISAFKFKQTLYPRIMEQIKLFPKIFV